MYNLHSRKIAPIGVRYVWKDPSPNSRMEILSWWLETILETVKISLGRGGPRRITKAWKDYVYQIEELRNGTVKNVNGTYLKFSSDSSLEKEAAIWHVVSSETGRGLERLFRFLDAEDGSFMPICSRSWLELHNWFGRFFGRFGMDLRRRSKTATKVSWSENHSRIFSVKSKSYHSPSKRGSVMKCVM